MILIDAGPIIALLDKGDEAHVSCRAFLDTLSGPLLTTWPCIAEAMYLLGDLAGHRGQDALWGYLEGDLIDIHVSSKAEQSRMRELMSKYQDTPMDLADASLVAASEVLALDRIFTLDSDFYIYRTAQKEALTVLHGPYAP